MSACRSCGHPVVWVIDAGTGSRMPMDAEPSDDGNMVVVATVDGITSTRVLGANETVDETRPRHKSHFATCPQAGSWRKR